MKLYASILSFYFLSLAFAPAIGYAYSKFSSDCGSSCSAMESNDDVNNGCQQQECCFLCCFKTPVFPPSTYNIAALFQPEVQLKNNFGSKKIFVSPQSFDIWHPPRYLSS